MCTDVAVDVELDLGIIAPDDGIDAVSESSEEQPEAEKRHAKVPALSNETGQEYEQQE